ncbi:hypothetical protein [Tenacibaculum ovolyticum]|uniref:hypothetical protein n=1 Tax=Tenacibaculum ovolyticum TaxID=104270 RepID=UPI0007ED3C1A|nr:hypothetical protein [Tenacibaculum ovolyticum]
MSKKEIIQFSGLLLLSPLLFAVVLAVLGFILLLSPIAGITFVLYIALQTINDIHRRNKNFKLKELKNETRY